MTVIFFFTASSLPSVYPFRFAWTGFRSVHCTTTGCRRSNCRILSIPWTKRGRFVHTKNLRELRSRTQLRTKPRSSRGCFFFKRQNGCEKENLGQKPLDSKDFDFEKDLGDATNLRGFWNRIKKIEVQNQDSFEAFSGAISMAPFASSKSLHL